MTLSDCHLFISPSPHFSKKALQFLAWYAKKHGVNIRTANTPGGEKRVGPYKLDGYIEEKKFGLEIHGCAFHGCPKCYPADNYELPYGRTAGKQRRKDQRRLDFIEAHPDVAGGLEVYWECELDEMLRRDKEMKRFYEKEWVDDGPIQLRDAFFGGRTGPLYTYYKPGPDEQIGYLDVNSMYPTVW